MAPPGPGLHGSTWADLSLWTWSALTAYSWADFSADGAFPTYRVRAGFVTPTWAEINANYTWQQISESFTWEEIAAGPLSEDDVISIATDARLGDVFRRLGVGQATIVLDNVTGDYSPDNSGGPHTMRVRDVLSVKAITNPGSIFGLFSGLVDSYAVNPELDRRTTRVRAFDRALFLQRTVNLGLALGTTASSLMTDVLSASGFTAEWRSVDTMNDPIDVAFLDNQPGGAAMHTIIDAGAQFVYVAGDGKLMVKERNTDLTLTAVASYNEFRAMGSTLGAGRVVNDARIAGQPRAATIVGSIAWVDETQTIPADGSITFTLEYVDPVTLERSTPASSLATPVASTDYIAFANADGTGTDVTSSLGVAVTANALTAEIVVTNSISTAAFLTRFQLRGIPLSRAPAFQAQTEDSSSQAVYDRRTLSIQNDLVANVLTADNYAGYLVDRWKEPRGDADFELTNVFPDILQRQMLERVTLVESNTGVGSDYTITGIEHTITFGLRGTEHATAYTSRLADTRTYLVLDDATRGKLDDVNTLGF